MVNHWPYDSVDGNWMSIRDATDITDKERAIKRWMIWITQDFEKASVKGFSSRAWKTGHAFCAIISRIFPKELDYDEHVLNDKESTQIKRLLAAFKIAESKLQLKRPEKLLQDMLSKNPRDAHDTIDRTLLLHYLLELQPQVASKLACLNIADTRTTTSGSGTDTE